MYVLLQLHPRGTLRLLARAQGLSKERCVLMGLLMLGLLTEILECYFLHATCGSHTTQCEGHVVVTPGV
jgi:hypothetical protein